MTTDTIIHWHGCYDDSWKGTITDEAFAHPAKFSKGLIERIADHLALPRGSVVVDPFGGVGLGGIVFASRGVQWVGCELEHRFGKLAQQNFELHRRTWEGFGDPLPVIVQGDSRRLREHVSGVLADCVVSSPPYAGSLDSTDQAFRKNLGVGKWAQNRSDQSVKRLTADYGQTPGQLGNMKSGEVDAVVSSPPYESSDTKPNQLGVGKGTRDDGDGAGRNKGDYHYSESADNIGNQTGDTFWTAARDIVAECHAILKPGGLAVWVCKDFVRKSQRVPFSNDWERLCVSCGFEPVERIHAQLVKRESHPSLFGGEETTTKERKSFFRRLAESKGSPSIDHEDVIVMRQCGNA